MKLENENISTPVYLKTDKNMEWPKDRLFYILSADGLFLCRNHEWFRSCSPAKHGPSELEEQKPFASIHYPKIPKALIEKALGFFRAIEQKKGSESALILVWNRITNQMELVCPDQKANYASVEYEIPKLPQHYALIGDIHSHPSFSPDPSFTDEKDEEARPGLHIVAGYINRPQPEFHCVAVLDGTRFTIKDHSAIMEPFESCDPGEAPKEWLDKVKALYQGSGSDGYYGGDYAVSSLRKPNAKDQKTIDRILQRFMAEDRRPTYEQVRQAMFVQTRMVGYVWCETRAKEFVEEWDKAHEKETTQTAPAS